MKREILSESPWMRITAKEETVEIDITGVIGGDWWDDDDEKKTNTKEKLKAELKALAGVKAKLIIVNIDSPGGMVSHGISMHDLLASNTAEVITKVHGMTASIATIIAQAGDRREISDNALYLIHRAQFGLMGGFNQNDLDDVKEDLEAVDNKLVRIYAKRSGIIPDVIEELMDKQNGWGTWITADEAKQAGLVDTIFEPMRAVASISPMILNKLRLSEPKINTMKKDEKVSALEELKNWITEKFGSKPEDIPQDVTDKLAEFEASINEPDPIPEPEPEADPIPDPIPEPGPETDPAIEALKAEVIANNKTIKEMQAAITKASGKSTIVAGPEGQEDPNDDTLTPEKKALLKDLKSLRNQLTLQRAD